MNDKEFFEEVKVMLDRIPDDGEVDFGKAAQTATTVIDIFGSLSKAAGQNIREDMYSMVLMTCIVLEAHSEAAGVAKSLFNSVFDDLFNRVRPEVSRLRKQQLEEKKTCSPEVGETVEINGKLYRCVLDETVCESSDHDCCDGCALLDPETDLCTAERIFCTSDYRPDGQDVKFVEEFIEEKEASDEKA